MKRGLLILLVISIGGLTFAQKSYEPNWESLDSRECPQWFPDAKFGIFIHWGLYSVPGYTNKGTYAEWYWNALLEDPNTANEKRKNRHLAIKSFHNKNYGADFKYADFRKDFTCELFNPTEWADIFKRSGAKYVVLTSKHHDGYCLWPNKEASTSFGMAWNSVESGPKRDLVRELTDAVRDEDIRMGLYYSIWDWFNPYWTKQQQQLMSSGNMAVNFNEKADKVAPAKKKELKAAKEGLSKYVHEVMYPQFKELVNEYQPSLLFSDGDWWMNDELWETKPMLAWLYNNAPNKEEVVINDRWGKGRGKHGGYYTTEYGAGFEGINKPWEENRGIGMSFGVNRIENIDDYRTEKELLFMLADLVSRGGNLLLNIGPNPDGTIPVIMQERLLQIGQWLDVNGEAIYGTRANEETAQWSEGQRPVFTKHDFHAGFPIYEMTIAPKAGNAFKECWYTRKENTLYALMPGWPKSNQLILRDLDLGKGAKVSMLGLEKQLDYTIEDGQIMIDLSTISINDLPCNHIYTIKITNVN